MSIATASWAYVLKACKTLGPKWLRVAGRFFMLITLTIISRKRFAPKREKSESGEE